MADPAPLKARVTSRVATWGLALAVLIAGCAGDDGGSRPDARDVPVDGSGATSDAAPALPDAPGVPDAPGGPDGPGHESVKDILVTPGAVDFGSALLGSEQRRPVSVVNEGSAPLRVAVPSFDEPHPALALEDLPGAAVSLAPGGSFGFVVVFAPDAPFPFTTEPLARLRIRSDDPDEDPTLVPVFGNVDLPELVLDPADGLDFGTVPQTFSAERRLTLANRGTAPLTIRALRLAPGDGAREGELALVPDAAFPPTTEGGGEGSIPAGAAREVALRFTNTGAETGEVQGTLTVVTADPWALEESVPLRAQRGGAATCEVRLEPETYDFGTLPAGSFRDLTLRIRNVGYGACGFQSAAVRACTAPPFTGEPATCTADTESAEFSVVGTPLPTTDGIPPGGQTDLRVRFEAPLSAPPGGAAEHAGALQVTLYDPSGPGGDGSRFVVPPPTATGPVANLVGRSGHGRLSVVPDHVDFGLVTLGCSSQTHTIRLFSVGAPVPVTATEPGPDCDTGFAVEAPPIPAEGLAVTASSPLGIALRYEARVLGERRCELFISTGDPGTPVLVVPLTAEGTLTDEQVDVFRQEAGRPVDVLFVIDDSGSMCERQQRLQGAVSGLLTAAQAAGSPFRIGVIGMCVQDETVCEGAGRLRSDFYEAPDWERWVDDTTWPHLVANVDLGCSGSSDTQEAGLEAARLALSPPLTRLTEDPCAGDAECPPPAVCVRDLGVCGGFNGGFLRPDAGLEVIVLSDEEDQSPTTPDFYVSFLAGLKGGGAAPARLHAIVGDADHGCGDPNLGTAAEAGDRYIYVAEATGGLVGSVCRDDYDTMLAEVGALAFAPQRRYALSRAADPATLAVSVGGVPCPTGWRHDPVTNSVRFDEDSACLPEPGDEIRIEYRGACAAG